MMAIIRTEKWQFEINWILIIPWIATIKWVLKQYKYSKMRHGYGIIFDLESDDAIIDLNRKICSDIMCIKYVLCMENDSSQRIEHKITYYTTMQQQKYYWPIQQVEHRW